MKSQIHGFRRRLPGALPLLAALVAATAQAQTPPLSAAGRVTEMVCFRDLGGNAHRLGEQVLTRDGATVGWISIGQCSGGLSDGKLHVRLDGDFGDDLALLDPADVTPQAGEIVLTLSAAEVSARFPRKQIKLLSRP